MSTFASRIFGRFASPTSVPRDILTQFGRMAYYLSPIGRRDMITEELIARQITAGQILLPEAWDRYVKDSLPLRKGPSVLPTFFDNNKDTYETNKRPRYADGITPDTSIRYNLAGLEQTMEMLSLCIWRHIRVEGWNETYKSLSATLKSKAHAPVSPKYLQEFDVLIRQWALRWARANKINVRFENVEALEKIPKGAPVVWTAFPHSSIYPDFLFWIEFPRVRFVADVKNFHDHPYARLLGWILDVVGNPFVDRDPKTGPERNKLLYPILTGNMMNYGTEPLFFMQGTRASRRFDDDGSLLPPTIYSAIASMEYPDRYYNPLGTAETVFQATAAFGRPAYVPVIIIEGGGEIMPKIAKYPPFIQPDRAGGTVTYRIADILEVPPLQRPPTQKDRVKLGIQVFEAARKKMGPKANDEALKQDFSKWAEEERKPHLIAEFARRAERNQDYYGLVARIESIHPKLPGRERQKAKQHLFTLLENPASTPEAFKALHQEVVKIVKETEYLTDFGKHP